MNNCHEGTKALSSLSLSFRVNFFFNRITAIQVCDPPAIAVRQAGATKAS